MTADVRIGIDIGGTFTDFCLLKDGRIASIGKALTTPDDPAIGVETGLRSLLSSTGLDASEVAELIHGTTLVTNALLERRGARTAMVTSRGFRDVLELGREHRYELHDLMVERPAPLVPRHLRFDVQERIHANGHVGIELNLDELATLAHELVTHEIEAVAVCFLHSYRYPEHEQRARTALLAAEPRLRVSISSDISPTPREYERFSTAVANVYVQGRVEAYLARLVARLLRLGFTVPPYIMLSNGGIATAETASRFPIRMLESGPAGGAIAAASLGRRAGWDQLLAFDMGGTTAKFCVIEGGEPLVAKDFEVDRAYRLMPGSGLPVNVSVIDMIEIGVGGGSIAGTDALGLVQVGPCSAGAVPGPACYGQGGADPTVTDADLILGYLDPAHFLGGELALDGAAARLAVEIAVARPLGLDALRAAWGIHSTVNEAMANAARVHAIERGKDPRGLPMMTFGGAGPVHGAGVAAALGASHVVIPPAAGVLSAYGFLVAPAAFDFVRPASGLLDDIREDEVDRAFQGMEDDGLRLLVESGVAATQVTHHRFADVRYLGQGFEVRTPLPSIGSDWRARLLESFDAVYRRLYRRAVLDVPIEVMTWRVTSTGPRPEVSPAPPVAFGTTVSPRRRRDAYFPKTGVVGTPVYERRDLHAAAVIDGPAIVQERETSVVVPPGCRLTVGSDRCLIITMNTEAAHG